MCYIQVFFILLSDFLLFGILWSVWSPKCYQNGRIVLVNANSKQNYLVMFSALYLFIKFQSKKVKFSQLICHFEFSLSFWKWKTIQLWSIFLLVFWWGVICFHIICSFWSMKCFLPLVHYIPFLWRFFRRVLCCCAISFGTL